MPLHENIASFYVREMRMRERIDEINGIKPQKGAEFSALLPKLAHQSPNRAYCAESGMMGRVVFFEDCLEKYPYNAYWEVVKPGENGLWDTVKKEIITGKNVKALEEEIALMRGRFQLKGDLLLRPDSVYGVVIPQDSPFFPTYLHKLTVGNQSFVGMYHVSHVGARFSWLGPTTETEIQEVETVEIPGVPLELVGQTQFKSNPIS